MKKIIGIMILTLAVFSVSLIGGFLRGSVVSLAETDEIAKSKITVMGEGVVTVKPDTAYVNIGVTTKNKEAKVAQEENKKIINNVINALVEFGLDKENITTSNYSLYKTTIYNKDVPEDWVIANNTLKVKTKDLESVGSIIDIAAQNGANKINSVRFELEDTSKAYNKALILAMKAAKGKADAIMETFGEKAIKPSSVIENSYGGRVYYENTYSDFSAKALSASTPITSDDIKITANVTVEYQY